MYTLSQISRIRIQIDFEISIENKEVSRVKRKLIDEHLTWKLHITSILEVIKG